MRLSDCKSIQLLPRFAQNKFIQSVCNAIDELVHTLDSRCNALPCETSTVSLASCRDDELAQIADDLGVIPYYPDLSREKRENIILKAKTWTRYAGTTGAIVAMVNALFDTDSTTIVDNLDDAYHYHINIADNFVESTETNFRRFNECLEMLGHTTTTPDGFTFYYEGAFEANAAAVSGDILQLYDTNRLCKFPEIFAVMGVFGERDIRLYVNGSMERGSITYPERELTENHEVYGDRLEVWSSSYTPPPAVVFPDKTGDESTEQMHSGTIRKWGNKANRGTPNDGLDGSMSRGDILYPVRELTENHEVYGDRLEVWSSSYTPPPAVVFPDKTGTEPDMQMMAGTLRKWGDKANRGIEMATVAGASMVRGSILYPERTLSENHEVYGDTIKIYNKSYTPVIIVFPDKGQTEPSTQMIGGTIRIKGDKANRGISLENITGQITLN